MTVLNHSLTFSARLSSHRHRGSLDLSTPGPARPPPLVDVDTIAGVVAWHDHYDVPERLPAARDSLRALAVLPLAAPVHEWGMSHSAI